MNIVEELEKILPAPPLSYKVGKYILKRYFVPNSIYIIYTLGTPHESFFEAYENRLREIDIKSVEKYIYLTLKDVINNNIKIKELKDIFLRNLDRIYIIKRKEIREYIRSYFSNYTIEDICFIMRVLREIDVEKIEKFLELVKNRNDEIVKRAENTLPNAIPRYLEALYDILGRSKEISDIIAEVIRLKEFLFKRVIVFAGDLEEIKDKDLKIIFATLLIMEANSKYW